MFIHKNLYCTLVFPNEWRHFSKRQTTKLRKNAKNGPFTWIAGLAPAGDDADVTVRVVDTGVRRASWHDVVQG